MVDLKTPHHSGSSVKPTAYSYVRFSQLSQSKGGSLERQSMSAQEYCEREGLTLDNHVYKDLGVSGFKGKNAKEGALKEFMEAVEAKKIKAGSLLLIEDMDRLTRLPVLEGLAVFQRILAGGITLVTLKNGTKYSTESLNKDWTQLMPVLFDMSRGWGESDRKSNLLSKAWRKKKEAAASPDRTPLGNNAPMWLDYVYDKDKQKGEYRRNEPRVAAVKRMFELSLAGYGFSTIAMMLQSEGFRPFKAKEGSDAHWGTTTISRTLSNRSVIGEYQPRTGTGPREKREKAGPPIPNFYPVVVEPDVFRRVQDAIKSRKIHRTTRQMPTVNLWQGVGLCAKCSASMLIDKKGKGLNYLICSNKKFRACDARMVRLEPSEVVFKEILALTGNTSLVQDDAAQKEARLQAARGRLLDEQAEYESLIGVLKVAPSIAVGQLVASQEAKVTATRDEIAQLEAELAASTVIDRETFFQKLDLAPDNREARNQSNALMKRLEIKVTMLKDATATRYSVYQKGRLIAKLSEVAGEVVDRKSYSSNVTWRMFGQGLVKEEDLEVNATLDWKLPPKKSPEELTAIAERVPVTSDGPDWSQYDDSLPDDAYTLVDENGELIFPPNRHTYTDEYSVEDENGNPPSDDVPVMSAPDD